MVATDVNLILDEILSGYKSREFELADIELEKALSPHLPQVKADPDQLSTALGHLISNATDAMPEGGQVCVAVVDG